MTGATPEIYSDIDRPFRFRILRDGAQVDREKLASSGARSLRWFDQQADAVGYSQRSQPSCRGSPPPTVLHVSAPARPTTRAYPPPEQPPAAATASSGDGTRESARPHRPRHRLLPPPPLPPPAAAAAAVASGGEDVCIKCMCMHVYVYYGMYLPDNSHWPAG